MRAALAYIFLFLILLAGFLFPLICTAIIWLNERRLIIFVANPENENATALEKTLWVYCKTASVFGVLSCVGLALIILSK